MSTLKNTIESLAAQFATSIVNALKGAAIDELAGYTGMSAPKAAKAAPAPKAAPAKAAPAPKAAPAKAAPAPKPAAAPAAAPAKRGPGRPKKVAAAAPAPAPAPAPVKRGPGRPKKVAAAAPAPAPKAAPKPVAVKKTAAAKPARILDSGRLGRRSLADIAGVVDEIVSLLGRHPEGLRSEQIRSALNLQAKELPRPLQDGLDAGTITKVGQKRATTYFAGGKGKKKR